MITKDTVESLALHKIKELNSFLVNVTVSSSNDIVVLFDNNNGVSFDDCLSVSRYIENNLDRDIEDYKLTVCSPGIGNPFIVDEQYIKNIGRDIKLITKDGENIIGKLIDYNENIVIETLVKNKKQKEIKRLSFPISKIKQVKLIVKFK